MGRPRFHNLTWLTKLRRTWTSRKGRCRTQPQPNLVWFSDETFQPLPSTTGSITDLLSEISTSSIIARKATSPMQLTKSSYYARTPTSCTALHARRRHQTPCWIILRNLQQQVDFWSETCQVLRSVCWCRILWKLVHANSKQWPLDRKITIRVRNILCRVTYCMGF